MKFTLFFKITSIFLSLGVQKCFGEEIKAESLKRGDYVGVKIFPSMVQFNWVVTDGVSPFPQQSIFKVYKLSDKDYLPNVERIYGQRIPGWLYLEGRLHERTYTPREKIRTDYLRKGYIVGVLLSAGTIKYEFVEENCVSPFPEKTIIEVYIHGPDYKANVEKYIGEIVPGWVKI